MSSTSGPVTGTCPVHGTKVIVSMDAETVTFACTAVGNHEDGFKHQKVLCVACGGPLHRPTWGCARPRPLEE